ncbi:ABC transporter ATP-binding protein [Psychromonas sp. RZ22]|uniref:ABC transporter ATP-binding protein n=1 Tax=Psychromonas algarum TaxID=2555643 RepID=UPI0010677280|nr:ABC transporter ATP-binding protein [Psychromonas sp. RZ22]TEW53736.1 ABC transporter ATP-binding protein [Psychromonas sp. RZ22]
MSELQQPSITIRDASLRYNESQLSVLQSLNMDIPAAQWTCILGRSGCGKSSLLRYLANLLDNKVQWSGQLSINCNIKLQEQVAYMAQQDLLMPWLSVLDNVMLSEQFGVIKKASQQEKAQQLLAQVGLADKAHYLPQQLSGGMRQRVALARTLMQNKPIVLMDEPFSALDAVTRYRLQNLAHQLLKNKTVVLITHDPQEAIRLADQLYIMQGQPAFAEALTVPTTSSPRKIDAQCALLQQTIIERLEQDYE